MEKIIPLNRFGEQDGRYSYTTSEEKRAKQKERGRRWYLANKEKMLAACKLKYQENREAIKARVKKRADENKEAKKAYQAARYLRLRDTMAPKLAQEKRMRRARDPVLQRQKDAEYRRRVPEKLRENQKRYVARHHERILRAQREWAKNNPEKIRHKVNIRRALLVGASVGDLTLIAAWERGWRTKRKVRCYWCNHATSGKTAHADHITPLVKGGAHSVENMAISCASCNLSKGANMPDLWNQKLAEPALPI